MDTITTIITDTTIIKNVQKEIVLDKEINL